MTKTIKKPDNTFVRILLKPIFFFKFLPLSVFFVNTQNTANAKVSTPMYKLFYNEITNYFLNDRLFSFDR